MRPLNEYHFSRVFHSAIPLNNPLIINVDHQPCQLHNRLFRIGAKQQILNFSQPNRSSSQLGSSSQMKKKKNTTHKSLPLINHFIYGFVREIVFYLCSISIHAEAEKDRLKKAFDTKNGKRK